MGGDSRPELSERFPAGAEVAVDDLAGPDLHRVLARLRATEPVSWVPALGAWLVTSHESVLAALRDPAAFTVDDPRFTTARVVGPSMLSTDGPTHREHRRPWVAPFGRRVVDQRDGEPTRALADELVSALVDRGRGSGRGSGRAELRSELAGPLAVATIARVLGLDRVLGAGSAATIGRWYQDIVAGVEALTAGRDQPDATGRAVAALREAVARSTSPLVVDRPFGDVAVVLFGAIETAEGMTASALFHLLSDPALSRRVTDDRSLIGPLIEESIRLEPAAAVVDRYATTDVAFGPDRAPIRAGDPVVLSLAGANRDPVAFPDPDRLRLDRAASSGSGHLAFAAGPHACIGLHLARLETEAAIGAVLDHLPSATLDAAASTPPTGPVFRKPRSVVVHWPNPDPKR